MKRPVSKTRCPVVAVVLCVSSAVVPPEVLLLEGDKREGRLRCQNESEGVDGGVVEELSRRGWTRVYRRSPEGSRRGGVDA